MKIDLVFLQMRRRMAGQRLNPTERETWLWEQEHTFHFSSAMQAEQQAAVTRASDRSRPHMAVTEQRGLLPEQKLQPFSQGGL